ncbi:MAG: hypothetical protein IJ624_00420 [Prevotella sp.]|nr:hypothetical protein [Prevotella sp.]
MRQFLTLILLAIFHSAFGQTFYESFDGCEGVGGNDGYWNKTTVEGNVVTDNEGWKFDGASVQGNKCARLGSSTSSGYATTPSLGIEGDATLTFRAGPWTGWPKELEISITGGGGKVDTKAVTMVEETFTTFTIALKGLTPASRIHISSPSKKGRFFLDDVLVEPANPTLPTITIAGDNPDDDNSQVISDNVDKTVDVKVARTMEADGGWYTLCLPFEITADDISTVFGGAQVHTMTAVAEKEGRVEIIFSSTDHVEAGRPFIICPAEDIADMTFKAKTITAEDPLTVTLTSTLGSFSFRGIYAATTLSTDGTDRFLSSDGRTLTKPKGSSQLKALRAYFEVPAESEVEITTGIEGNVRMESKLSPEIYDLHGRRITSVPPRGIYIVGGKKRAIPF